MSPPTPTRAVLAALARLEAAQGIGGGEWAPHALALLGYIEALHDAHLDDVRARRRAEAERDAETARVDRLRAAVRAQLNRTDPGDPGALVELCHALDGLLNPVQAVAS